MELLLDIGNSRIKWSDRERLLRGDVSVAATNDIQGLLDSEWCHLQRPESVWISSVVSISQLATLLSWLQDAWNITPSFASSYPQQLGVVNGYVFPSQLGVDRWMSLISARTLFNRALIVVDCGTSTTIDAMGQDGHHLGGIILPGLRMMRDSLLQNTAIPESGRASHKNYFAQDTATGIESGAVLSTLCVIERYAEILREKVGGEINCVLTGGGADEIKEFLSMNFYHEPNLVLQGLALVARADQV